MLLGGLVVYLAPLWKVLIRASLVEQVEVLDRVPPSCIKERKDRAARSVGEVGEVGDKLKSCHRCVLNSFEQHRAAAKIGGVVVADQAVSDGHQPGIFDFDAGTPVVVATRLPS